MSELFLELFSEEMPSGLQKHAREGILKLFNESFDKLNINFKTNKSYSTPKRLVFFFEGIAEKIEKLIKKYSKKIPILKAGNMSIGINLLMYLTEITSKSLGDNFLSKVFEMHHKHKKDHPSGTALMLGKGIAVGKKKDFYKLEGKKYLNKKTFPYSKKINFNSIRKGEIVGNHKVFFSSGKETITLDHEAFDRALYAEGAFTASKWLMGKKPGLYSMRNVLNYK